MNILAICGSLRQESLNRKVLLCMQELAPKNLALEIAYLYHLPLYNQDVEDQGFPGPVMELVEQVQQADAVIFGTPEYNYSIPGVLKNALDWLSRHPSKPFNEKTAAIVGASPGRVGTARAQYHLRQMGVFLNINFLNRPEIMIAEAHKKFDSEGNLKDEETKKRLINLLEVMNSTVKSYKNAS